MASIDYPRTDARSVEEVEEAGRPPPLLPPSSPPPWPQQLQRQQRRPRQQRLQTARRRAAPCPVAISSAMSFPSRSSKSRSRRSHSTSVPTEHRMWHTSSLVGSAAAGATPSIVAGWRRPRPGTPSGTRRWTSSWTRWVAIATACRARMRLLMAAWWGHPGGLERAAASLAGSLQGNLAATIHTSTASLGATERRKRMMSRYSTFNHILPPFHISHKGLFGLLPGPGSSISVN